MGPDAHPHRRCAFLLILGLQLDPSAAGIGPDSADAIAEAYPTPRSLYEAYARQGGDAALEKHVGGIRAKETGRRIGPAKTQKFLDSLFP